MKTTSCDVAFRVLSMISHAIVAGLEPDKQKNSVKAAWGDVKKLLSGMSMGMNGREERLMTKTKSSLTFKFSLSED